MVAAVLRMERDLPEWIIDDPSYPPVKRYGGDWPSEARARVSFRRAEFTGELLKCVFVFPSLTDPLDDQGIAVWIATNFDGVWEMDRRGRFTRIDEAPGRGHYVIRARVTP
jgi:hypothetical protein